MNWNEPVPYTRDTNFWQDKRVFMTGHTGFKGSWLSLWLTTLGAEVTGFALEPPTHPNLFNILQMENSHHLHSIHGDVRDGADLQHSMRDAEPDIVIHMAAQPLVRTSYETPVDTYAVNVMGTVHLLEAVRNVPSVKAVLIVTSDKSYANQEWVWGYRETDTLGGDDPYASSKACAELVTDAYRKSFFHPNQYQVHGVAIASARAGNVIGGGDWATNRLIPDCLRAVLDNEAITIRNPQAIRPWQHVLEPLQGYLTLAERLYTQGPAHSGAWNFGPDAIDAKPVHFIVGQLCEKLGHAAGFRVIEDDGPYESTYLRLDASKAQQGLGWHPRWDVDTALDKVVEWFQAYRRGENLREVCVRQIEASAEHGWR